jgi:hypothetical protein
MQDKHKVTLYLPPELHHQLKLRAAIESEPISAIAEKALSKTSEISLSNTPSFETDTSENKQKVTLYLPPELHRQLKITSAADAVQLSDIAERAIVFYLTNSTSTEFEEKEDVLQTEIQSQGGLEPHRQLALNIDLTDDTPTDAVVLELVELCKAINAYHIACGGTGLEIDDWELLVRARQLVGV